MRRLALILGAGALVFGGVAVAAQPAGPFALVSTPESPIHLDGYGDPWAAAFGDLNGDRRPDLVVANSAGGNSNVSVLLGAGAGRFTRAPGSPVAVERYPQSVVLEDFSGDGHLDAAVGDAGSQQVSVLLGDGTGRFTGAPGSPINLRAFPQGLVGGDFNGDRHADIATVNTDERSVSVLLGDGTGRFTSAPGSPIRTGNLPYAITSADFNGDHRADLAVSDRSNIVIMLRGDGTGRFETASATPVGDDPRSIARGDFNGDGRADLVTGNAGDSGLSVSVLLGDGAGRFTHAPGSSRPIAHAAVSVAVADLNGDGIQDLATANGLPNSTILVGDGTGRFHRAPGSPAPAGEGPAWVGATDLNADHRNDLVIVSGISNSLTVLLNRRGPGASAGVTGTTGCARDSHAHVTVHGRWITRVEFRLDGRTPTSLTRPNAARGRYRYEVRVAALRHGRHRIRAVVHFATTHRTAAFSRAFRRCGGFVR